MTTEQEITTQLTEVASLVGAGRQSDAAAACRDILKLYPHHIPTLVWLGFCTSDLNEAYEATARAYLLSPDNPDVLQAINAYNTRQAEAVMNAGPGALVEVPFQSVLPPLPTRGLAGAPNSGAEVSTHSGEKRQFRPLGDPVRDHHSKNPLIRFVMSERGGLFLVALVFFFGSIGYLIFTGFQLVSWRYNMGGEANLLIRGGIALFFLLGSGLWLFTLGQDYLKPVQKSYGAISNRRAERKEVKSDNRTVGIEFYYTADFTPIDEPPGTPPILLRMSEMQYQTSGKSRWAYVEYRAKSGFVSLYQAVQ